MRKEKLGDCGGLEQREESLIKKDNSHVECSCEIE